MNESLTQLVNFFYSIVIGGTATGVLTELFKFPIVPIAAKKYPRTTATVLSFLSSVIAVLIQGSISIEHWATLLATAAGTFLIAVLTFKTALKGLSTNAPSDPTPVVITPSTAVSVPDDGEPAPVLPTDGSGLTPSV